MSRLIAIIGFVVIMFYSYILSEIFPEISDFNVMQRDVDYSTDLRSYYVVKVDGVVVRDIIDSLTTSRLSAGSDSSILYTIEDEQYDYLIALHLKDRPIKDTLIYFKKNDRLNWIKDLSFSFQSSLKDSLVIVEYINRDQSYNCNLIKVERDNEFTNIRTFCNMSRVNYFSHDKLQILFTTSTPMNIYSPRNGVIKIYDIRKDTLITLDKAGNLNRRAQRVTVDSPIYYIKYGKINKNWSIWSYDGDSTFDSLIGYQYPYSCMGMILYKDSLEYGKTNLEDKSGLGYYETIIFDKN